jgi:uncharacterized protein YacL
MSVEPDPPSRTPRRQHRAGLVEGVRLIILALSTAGGYGIGKSIEARETRLSTAIALGALIGYVAGGVFGRSTVTAVTAVERRFQKASAAEILAGTVGLTMGLFVAFLVTFPLLLIERLPGWFSFPALALAYLVLGWLGYRVGSNKRDDFFGLLGLKPRAAGTGGGLEVLDTSALIDGRILDVVRSGFLRGTLLVPDGVLNELRAIAEASDEVRRDRGRRGLDVLESLQRDPNVDVVLVDGVPAIRGQEVDAALVTLARERGATLVTNDVRLSTIAESGGVPVRAISKLAAALRPPVAPGQDLDLQVAKRGREANQGVGYLEDGTMVVVKDGGSRVGDQVHVRVTNITTTANGRLLFAELAERARG